MMNQLIMRALIALVACLLVAPASLGARTVDRLIAVIDGEPYTLRNVEHFAKRRLNREFPTGDLGRLNDVDADALEQFITEKLLEAEVRQAGITVTPEDVETYIAEVKKTNHMSDDDLKAVIAREGMTWEAYKAVIKGELEKNELVRRTVRSKISVTDADVEQYYKLNSHKYRAGDRARIRHILFSLSPTAKPEVVQSTLTKARETYRKITNGADFAALARDFSEGAGRGEGGDIGWVKRGALIGDLDEVAFEKLSVGQVSEPFRTHMGFHIVKLEDREIGEVQPLAAVAAKIKNDLYAKALEERYLKWLKTDLRRKHRVDVKLAGVVFKPEESKEGTLDSLIARSNRIERRQERTFLSYFNPFSYITRETPLEELDPNSPLADKNVVSVFGVPLFTTDRVDNVPDPFAKPPEAASGSANPNAKP